MSNDARSCLGYGEGELLAENDAPEIHQMKSKRVRQREIPASLQPTNDNVTSTSQTTVTNM